MLEHVYTGRPPAASTLLSAYLARQAPRPALIHLPSTNPPSLLFSLAQDRLLFLCSTSTDTEPLLVLEFLHRVADALEEFLGSPLLSSRIEANYDVVAQIVGEICDAGAINTTEPNALREVVETETWTGQPPRRIRPTSFITGLSRQIGGLRFFNDLHPQWTHL